MSNRRNDTTQSRPHANSGDLYHDFHDRFMQLAREEQGQATVVTKGAALRTMRVLRISCSYHKHPEIWVEKGKPEQGSFCLLDTPPHGVWGHYIDSISENFLERVRLCVAQAGHILPDYPKGTDAEDFWLDRLYLDLLRNNSDQLFAASNEGGMIISVCVASATFCSRLERQALEQSEPGDSTVAESLRTGAKQAEGSRAQNSANSAQSAESESTTNAAADNTRKVFLKPILKSKGLSIRGWARKANVDFHTADNYLKGKTKPHPNTLKQLADALDVKVEKLPT